MKFEEVQQIFHSKSLNWNARRVIYNWSLLELLRWVELLDPRDLALDGCNSICSCTKSHIKYQDIYYASASTWHLSYQLSFPACALEQKQPPSFGQKCPDQMSCMISDYVMVFCLSNPVQHLLLVRSNHLPAAAESVCHPLTWEHLMNVYMVRPISRFPDVSHPLPSHRGTCMDFSHFSWGYKFTKTQVCTWFKNNQKWMDCLVSLRKPLAMAVATVMDFYSALQPCWAWFPSAIVILGLYNEFEW